MPDNEQARTDPMEPGPQKKGSRGVVTVILLLIIIGVIGAIVFI